MGRASRRKQTRKPAAEDTAATTAPRTEPSRDLISARTTWIILGVILLLGLVLRLAYLSELKDAPDFEQPLADAMFHDYWARGLATGDWLPPAAEADPRIREAPYLRPPGYPYFLAVAYELTGGSYYSARVLQFMLGLVNCVLAFVLARQLFNRVVGLIAAGLCATSWAMIYFEGELQAPVLIITLSLWMLLLLRKWVVHPKWWPALGGGLLLGLLALVRANVLLFIPVAALWMWWAGRNAKLTHKGAIAHAAVFVLGTIIAIAPATIRNARVAGEFVLISTNGAINLYIGNNPVADGVTAKIPDLQELTGSNSWSWFNYPLIVDAVAEREGERMGYTDVASYFTDKAVEWITSHPGEFIALTMKRALLFWGPDEISNNKAIGVIKRNSDVLRYLPPFPVVLSIALTGVVLLIIDYRRRAVNGGNFFNRTAMLGTTLMLVGAYIIVYCASFVPFLAAGRFRVPLIPLLVMLGAYAIYRVAQMVTGRAWAGMAGTVVLWLALFGVSWLPSAQQLGGENLREKDALDTAMFHTDQGVALMNQGDTTAAIAEFQRALEALPGYIDARIQLADARVERGEFDAAVNQLATVLQARPDRDDVRQRLVALLNQQAEMLLRNGEPQGAVAPLRRALEVDGDRPNVLVNLGVAYARLEQREEALRQYRKALAIDPGFADAHFNRGVVLQDLGRVDEALAAYSEAVELRPDHTNAMVNIGIIHSQNGRIEDAMRWYRRAIKTDPNHVLARLNLAGALANFGRLDESEEEFMRVLEIDPNNQTARQRLQRVRELKSQR